MKLLVHRGTGTVINLDDDVFVIETDNLTDQENDIIESGSDSGIAEVAHRAGTRLTPTTEDEALSQVCKWASQFWWVTSVITTGDIANMVRDDFRKTDPSEVTKIVEAVKNTRAWVKYMEEGMSEEGFRALEDTIYEVIEGNAL